MHSNVAPELHVLLWQDHPYCENAETGCSLVFPGIQFLSLAPDFVPTNPPSRLSLGSSCLMSGGHAAVTGSSDRICVIIHTKLGRDFPGGSAVKNTRAMLEALV